MFGVKIRDSKKSINDGNILSFDLQDILAVIGEPVLKSKWRCRNLCYTASRNGGFFEFRETRLKLSGKEIVQLASEIHQTIDGQFEARGEGAAKNPWLIIIAFDSAWFEVWSSKPATLELIRKHFKKVSDISNNTTETGT